jgi:2-polyprenyl-3-methyl-5-hydroxy-6-metoxy-1,4-benzoquinol methylase
VLEKREEFRNQYDVAILFDVIEHIEPTRPFLEAVLFHLKPGGILLVNEPAFVLRVETDVAQPMRTGFVPPSPTAHRLLKGIMTTERALLHRPPFGSSLLAAIRKNA